jgi:hypothetical protein
MHGLLMLLVERGHGLAGVIRDPEGERVRLSWLQPDTVGASSSPLVATARPLIWAAGPVPVALGCILVVSSRSVILCARWVVAWTDLGVAGGRGSRWLDA